jgi:hypothetical protein
MIRRILRRLFGSESARWVKAGEQYARGLAAGLVEGAARPCIPPPPPSSPRAEFRAGARPWNYSRPGQAEKELREQLEYMLDIHGEDALCRRLAEAAAKRASGPRH